MAKKPNKRVSPNEVYSYLISKGVPTQHAIGMMANIRHESNFIPTAIGDSGTSGGFFQHHASRFTGLKKHTGGDLTNWKKQIDYALSESDTKNYLKKDFKTPEEASYWFTTKWERPANAGTKAVQRQGWIKEFMSNRGKDWNAPTYNPEGLSEEELYASNMPTVEGEYQAEVPAEVLAQQQKRDKEVEDLRAENKRLSEKEDEDLAAEKEKTSKEKQELLAAEEEQMKQTQFADALAEVKPQAPYQEPTEDVSRNPELYQQNLGFEVQQAQNLFQGSIPTPEVQEAKYGGYFEDGGVTIPVIEDMGDMVDIPDFGKTWVPNWSKMAEQAKKLGAKKVKTRSGTIIEFDDNWKPITSDDNPSFGDGGKQVKEKPADQEEFKKFHDTLPKNLQDPNFETADYSAPDQYNLYGMWETVGKPKSFEEVKDGDYFPLQSDGTYHGFTVGGDNEFLKPINHPTVGKELWFAKYSDDPYFRDNQVIVNEKGRYEYVPNYGVNNSGPRVQNFDYDFKTVDPNEETTEYAYGGEVDDSTEFNNFYQSLPISLQTEDNLDNLHSLWIESGKVSSYDEIDTPDNFDFERQVLEYGDGGKTTYTFPERDLYKGEDEYFYNNQHVGGMATEDNHIIINPYSKLNNEERDSIRKNEAARLAMRNGYPRPSFELSTEQKEKFGQYSQDEQDQKETIIGRIISGDPSVGGITKEQQMYADELASVLKVAPNLQNNSGPRNNIIDEEFDLGGTPDNFDFERQVLEYGNGGPVSPVVNTSGPRDFVPGSTDYDNYEPSDEEKAWMMSNIVRHAGQGNKAAMRMMNENTKDYTFTGEEYDEQMQRYAGVPTGEKGTHFSASMGNSFVPFIQEGGNGELYYNGRANPNDAEAIPFKSGQEAEFFANYYKKANPPMMREWTKNHYSEEEFDLGGTFDKLLDPNNITAFKKKYGI